MGYLYPASGAMTLHGTEMVHMPIGTDDVAATTASLPPILTTKEAADLMRVSERTVRRWISSGRLAVGRTTAGRGGRILIPRAAIERILRGV